MRPRTVALAALAVVLLPTISAHARQCDGPAPRNDAAGWTRLTPRYSAGPGTVDSVAVLPGKEPTLVVTNAVQVVATADGGCRWRTLLDLRTADLPYADRAFVTQLSASGNTLYAAVVESPPAVPADGEVMQRSRVLVSRDRGSTWRRADTGLDRAYGAPLRIVASPADAAVAYLLVDRAVAPPDMPVGVTFPRQLFVTDDGGSTWQLRSSGWDRPDGPSYDEVVDVVAHPKSPRWAWFVEPKVVQWSADLAGERTPMTCAVSTCPRPSNREFFADLAATIGGDGRLRATAFLGGHHTDVTSRDGRTFSLDLRQGVVYGALRAGTVLPRGGTAIATRDGVFVRSDSRGYVRVSTYPAPDVQELVAVQRAGHDWILGRTASALLLRTARVAAASRPGTVPQLSDDPTPGDVRLGGSLPPANAARAALSPDDITLTMPADRLTSVRYDLRLPERRAVDVFFLVDVSGSMGEEIAGLRDALGRIVSHLGAARVDAQYGVGIYRSYRSGPAYQRVADIQPAGPGLERALSSLVADGGDLETQLAALYQLATGEGQRDFGAYIEPGQQATFRPGSLRLVVHISDEALTEAVPQPTFAQAAGALNAVRAHHVGLAFTKSGDVMSTLPGQAETASYDGMRRLALATDALAPASGVDCDGDGTLDIQPHGALVCRVDSTRPEGVRSMAAVIVALVNALRDEAAVGLAYAGPAGVVAAVTPPVVSPVDLMRARRITFVVTYACVAPLGDVTLAAVARDATFATARARVVCAGVSPAAGGFPRTAVVTAVQQPPPQPIANPHANANPNPNANPQSQANPQGQVDAQTGAIAAADEQRAPAAALANQDFGEDGALAMSALEPQPWMVLACASVAAAGAAAKAHAHRPMLRPATARRRSGTRAGVNRRRTR